MAQEVTSPKNEIAVVRHELEGMGSQFLAALPAHIPVERFTRVVMTAIQNNGDLIAKCSRRSLWNACIKAAQDGLLPDGREGAIVPYGGEANWLPMVFGIRKKVRNSGEILDWDVNLVYENDQFEHEFGDDAFIKHKRGMGERGAIVGGYSICHLKGGGVSREIMSIAEIEAIRKQASKAKSDKSPWQIPAYYGEMCRKTIARRHSKMLPMSSDMDDLIRRDDDLYDMKGEGEASRPRRHDMTSALDKLAGPSSARIDDTPKDEAIDEDGVVGGKAEGAGTAEAGATAKAEGKAEGQQETAGREVATKSGGGDDGAAADKGSAAAPEPPKAKGKTAKEAEAPKVSKDRDAKSGLPLNERGYIEYGNEWIADTDPTEVRKIWTSTEQKDMRNKCNVAPETREEMFKAVLAREAVGSKEAE